MFITSYTSQQPVDDFGNLFANLLYSATLAATTDTSLTIPSNSPRYKALIKVSNITWVASNATAAAPGGASFAATTSELAITSEHLCREVKAGDVLHFFAPNASTEVSVVLYAAMGSSGGANN